MRNTVLTILAALTAGSLVGATVSAVATPLMRTVQCADGTVYNLGDEITDAQACANHGGVSKSRVILGGSGIQTNHGVPPEPNTNGRGKRNR
ncbi:MAG: hypothetical protein AAGF59_14130 [Pseudomonadota bacterium]